MSEADQHGRLTPSSNSRANGKLEAVITCAALTVADTIALDVDFRHELAN